MTQIITPSPLNETDETKGSHSNGLTRRTLVRSALVGTFAGGVGLATAGSASASSASVSGAQTYMPTLWQGIKGSDMMGGVRLLQARLRKYGYSLTVDGKFGSGTASAVRSFQSRHGLTVDGVVGKRTLSKLRLYSVYYRGDRIFWHYDAQGYSAGTLVMPVHIGDPWER